MLNRIKHAKLLILLSVIGSGLASAQSTDNAVSGADAASTTPATAAPPVYPCETDEAFQAFDFWVGEWDVHLADGRPAGTNRIAREEHGCVLTEHWLSASGGTGSSINYVDKISGEWVQIWNDASGSQINIRGSLTDAGMSLAGTIHYVASNTTYPFRGLWTPQKDGRVRQFFEQSTDDGETWSAWFEGFYTRKSAK